MLYHLPWYYTSGPYSHTQKLCDDIINTELWLWECRSNEQVVRVLLLRENLRERRRAKHLAWLGAQGKGHPQFPKRNWNAKPSSRTQPQPQASALDKIFQDQ